jgi:CRISPR-associated protein Cas2
MTIIIMERVPPRVRGELTRWMLELHAGVFVGRLSALVRDALWEHICKEMDVGAAWLVHQHNNEQGFTMRSWGATHRQLVDFDGLMLISVPK